MIRRSLFVLLFVLAPLAAHAEHERPAFDWHGAWSPYRDGGQYVLAGGSGRKWQVDFTALRAEGAISGIDSAAGDGDQQQFDAAGRAVIAGIGARRDDMKIYGSSDGDITWTANGSAQATVGADLVSSGRVFRGPDGSVTPEDTLGGGFVGAKVECEINSKLAVCGLVLGSKSGLSGGLGYGAYDSSPVVLDAAHDTVTVRLSPFNLYPGPGSTVDVTVDASQLVRDGQASHDCFHRHFPALTRGADKVARAVARAWAFLVNDTGRRGAPVTAGFGANVGRFAGTRGPSESASVSAANEGFQHGSGAGWLAR